MKYLFLAKVKIVIFVVCFSRYPLPCRVDIIHSKFSFNQKATTPFCIEQFFIIILSQIVINDVNSIHINMFFWIFFLPFRFVRSYFSFQTSFRFKATTSAFQFQSENPTCRREVNTNFIWQLSILNVNILDSVVTIYLCLFCVSIELINFVMYFADFFITK